MIDELVQEFGWMKHELLKRAVSVGKGLGRRAELHGNTEVVRASLAIPALLAVDARLLTEP